jgi:hypothetical protein
MKRTLTASVPDGHGGWRETMREDTSVTSQAVGDVKVDSYRLGVLFGTPVRVELVDETGRVLDSAEITAS